MQVQYRKSVDECLEDKYTLLKKCATVSSPLKGSSAVPIGETFEEPFWFQLQLFCDPSRTLSTEGSTWNRKGFDQE